MDQPTIDLQSYIQQGLNPKVTKLFQDLTVSYFQAVEPSMRSEAEVHFKKLLELVLQQLKQPHQFEIFHQSIRKPFDYYQFGLNFIRPLIDFKKSQVKGLHNVKKMIAQIHRGENVVLLANHQTEPDPQIISLLLEPIDPQFASEMIFVAGHKVISDPMAVPMSMGRNLLCIYSKKHIAHHPETKEEKVIHNQRTMKKMSELLSEGGHCIYVAPSGGRDRPSAEGIVEVAPFDPQSIEMFYLMAQQADKPTHFYPLALKTFDLMPPPRSVEKELGEKRHTKFTPVFLDFCDEVDMENFPGSEEIRDKKTKRTRRTEYIFDKVKEAYDKL